MLIAQAIAGVEAMGEWERLQLWWHWMIDHYTDNAKYAPIIRRTRHIGIAEFFRPTPSVNGPKWSAASEYYQYQFIHARGN